MIGGVSNGHFPQGGRQLAGPTDIAHCPITDCGLGGGEVYTYPPKARTAESQHITLLYALVTLRFLNRLTNHNHTSHRGAFDGYMAERDAQIPAHCVGSWPLGVTQRPFARGAESPEKKQILPSS